MIFKIRNKIPRPIRIKLPVLKILKIFLKSGSPGRPNLLRWSENAQTTKRVIQITISRMMIKIMAIIIN